MDIIRIKTQQDFDEVIEEIGKLQREIDSRTSELKAFVSAASAYAVKNDITEGVAGDYEYRLIAAARQLRVKRGVDPTTIAARLEADEELKRYVYKAVDREAIKADFGRNATSREAIERVGLFFTKPGRNKLKVSPRAA